MNRDEINMALGMSEEEQDLLANAYESDNWEASNMGKVIKGRPRTTPQSKSHSADCPDEIGRRADCSAENARRAGRSDGIGHHADCFG